jgi:hypothetical protein
MLSDYLLRWNDKRPHLEFIDSCRLPEEFASNAETYGNAIARAGRADRIAKCVQLLRIEEQIGQSAEFLGIESIRYSE